MHFQVFLSRKFMYMLIKDTYCLNFFLLNEIIPNTKALSAFIKFTTLKVYCQYL